MLLFVNIKKYEVLFYHFWRSIKQWLLILDSLPSLAIALFINDLDVILYISMENSDHVLL